MKKKIINIFILIIFSLLAIFYLICLKTNKISFNFQYYSFKENLFCLLFLREKFMTKGDYKFDTAFLFLISNVILLPLFFFFNHFFQ